MIVYMPGTGALQPEVRDVWGEIRDGKAVLVWSRDAVHVVVTGNRAITDS